MGTATSDQLYESWNELIRAWGEIWGLPTLADELTITLSSRFRTCLGRCTPKNNEIRIAAFLAHATSELLNEVLCHEAAHAAAFRLHGGRLRPHGREWAQLMLVAGFRPRASIPTDELDRQPAEMGRRRIRWEHRCPVCDMHHLAGRPVRAWRCAACRCRGLNGKLVISKVGGP